MEEARDWGEAGQVPRQGLADGAFVIVGTWSEQNPQPVPHAWSDPKGLPCASHTLSPFVYSPNHTTWDL